MTEIPAHIRAALTGSGGDSAADDEVIEAKNHLASAIVKAAGGVTDDFAKAAEYLYLSWGFERADPIVRRALALKLRQAPGTLGALRDALKSLAVEDNRQASIFGLFGQGGKEK